MKLKAIISVLFTVPLLTANTSIAQTIKTYNGPLESPILLSYKKPIVGLQRTEDLKISQQVAVEEEVIEEEPPFLVAETMPSFQGGDLNAFRNWVQSKVRYPAIAQENGISGRVVLTFVIEKDGRLTNIQVLQTPDRSLSEEAVRVLQQSPKWSPGKQRNQPVRVKYTLPVDFREQQ